MGLIGNDYKHVLNSLLPRGKAWILAASKQFLRLLHGFAAEAARVDANFEGLYTEAIPYTTNALISDWERVAGITPPDGSTIETRRAELLSVLTATGGQSKTYFIELAGKLGYIIDIEEFIPFRAGLGRAGDRLTNGDWKFTFHVVADESAIVTFTVGQDGVGTPLRYWNDDVLVELINRWKPAHTFAYFSYVSTYFRAGMVCGLRLREIQ